MREVAENLKNKELTLEDFTFAKEPVGVDDPEKEIIRDAKVPGSSAANEGKGSAKKKGVSGLKVGGKGANSPNEESPSVGSGTVGKVNM